MRAWAAHAVFAAILLGSLATGERANDALVDSASLEAAVLRIAGSQGWGLREYRPMSSVVKGSLVFEVPGCAQGVVVSILSSTFEEATIIGYAAEPGYARRYIYFDRTWDAPEPWAAFFERVKYRAIGMFGLTQYVPSHYLLLIETPRHCPAADTIDWAPAWKRDYLAAAQASAEVTTKH